MKQWRVGTLSMGVALILFGSVLFALQIKGKESFEALIDWWPMIFILLGVELLVYLGVSRMAQPIVKYDVFSILFVGFLCIAGLGGAILTSTGLMSEIRYAVSAEERTEQLADIDQEVPASVKRVIVQNKAGYSVLVDKTPDPSVHVFGTYQYTSYGKDESIRMPESLVTVKTVGDTMYVDINQPPHRSGIRSDYPHLEVTVVLPDHVQVDVNGNHQLM